MSAYLPTGAGALGSAIGLLAAILVLAFLVARLRVARLARAAAWALVPAAVVAADWVTAGEAPGFRMLVLITGLLLAMKAVVSVEAAVREGTRLPPSHWLAFATLWPGMRPSLFTRFEAPRAGAGWLIRRGVSNAVLGAALVALARLCGQRFESAPLATLVLLPGLSLLLHFGAFDVVAGLWRLAGVDAKALFLAPLRSKSLGEFWSRRWNLAFSEMTSLAVYRPLAETIGRPAGLFAAFLLSGLLHEVAISLPVRAGFGGPTAYFLIHGLLVQIERARGPLGRLGTIAALVLPLPLLFHPPFLRGVLWPLIGAR